MKELVVYYCWWHYVRRNVNCCYFGRREREREREKKRDYYYILLYTHFFREMACIHNFKFVAVQMCDGIFWLWNCVAAILTSLFNPTWEWVAWYEKRRGGGSTIHIIKKKKHDIYIFFEKGRNFSFLDGDNGARPRPEMCNVKGSSFDSHNNRVLLVFTWHLVVILCQKKKKKERCTRKQRLISGVSCFFPENTLNQ